MCSRNRARSRTLMIRPAALAAFLMLPLSGRVAHAQVTQAAHPTSSVRIPLKKERLPAGTVTTTHDTVTMFRVDTVRIVQTIVRTDTVFRTDTLRDSCSGAAFPVPIPVPIPVDHRHQTPPPAGVAVSVTPEPATFALVGTGLAALIGLSCYRRRK
jgi:hypothetical protein